jgi:hypothetical protein
MKWRNVDLERGLQMLDRGLHDNGAEFGGLRLTPRRARRGVNGSRILG